MYCVVFPGVEVPSVAQPHRFIFDSFFLLLKKIGPKNQVNNIDYALSCHS